nr:mucin-like protein [Bos taurus]
MKVLQENSPRHAISGSSHTEATTLIVSNSTSGTGLRPEDNTAVAGGQATGRVTGTTKVIPGTTVAPGSSNTESTTSLGESRTRIGRITGATTGTSKRSSPGSKTGNTGAISGTTVAPGSSNTGATTSLGSGETTQGGIKIVTMGVTTGTTIAPGSSNTKATTPTEVRTTTEVRTATETTTSRHSSDATGSGIQTGITGTGSGTTSSPGGFNAEATTFKEHVRTTETRILSGTTRGRSGTTVIPESSNTGTSTGVGRQTSTAVVSGRVTGVSESSSPGTSKEASETTTGPGISTTGSTSKSNRITTSSRIPYPETTVVATGEQETETKTGCTTSLPPPPACYGPLGEKKSPGDIWTANCHKCTCTDAETVDCKLKECPSPPTCKPEERLVKFKDNDTCCEIAYCEPRTCLFNNNDYEVGASFADPKNPCISYSCHNTGFVAVVQDCPKQTWCAEEDRVYDSTKCCYTCKPYCRSSSVNVTVNYNGCKKKVEMARCAGECKKTIKYDYDIFQLKNSCLCCQEENYEYREIDLDCPDGGTIPYRYRHIITCSCLDICQQSMTSTVS